MTDVNVTTEAEQATRRARLAETILLDRVVEQAAATHKHADPKAEPLHAVVWAQDAPPGGALIAGRSVKGKAGELQLVDAGVAQVLKDAGYVEVREPLTLPAWQRPTIAGELRATASELRSAADRLDPPTQPPVPDPEPAQREGG